MRRLPVRKCYQLAKLSVICLLVVTILTLFEYWRGGKRSARAAFLNSVEDEYELQIQEDEVRIRPGLGDGGVAVHLEGAEKRLGEESLKKLAVNVYLSDLIPYNRTLKDYRNPACKRVVYDAELPSASVILIFHNEPYSVVVRTLWSVVNSARRDQPWYKHANFAGRDGRTMTLGYPGQDPSSPFVYLKEIILVDDNSTLPELKGKLSHYIRTRMPPNLIRILRLPDRVGLTRARLAGARYATGDVIIFLDAHCETVQDWLRPLLARIKDAPHAVVVPIIDVVGADDFYYSVQDAVTFEGLMMARMRGARASRGDVLIFLDAHCEAAADWLRPLLQRIKHKRDAVTTPLIDVVDQETFQLDAAEYFQVGGFTFNGHFTWIEIPQREKKRRGSNIAPTWSPTMAGGLFAINRQYYWELGAYDEQMAGWGGENLEMSFRIWQCGGTLETIPCSRVGHVFRSFHPYGLPANSDTHGINTARMAEVWMDDYKELFYIHRPDLRKSPKIGDVTHRKVLREKLKCKSFQWYLDNIYKEKFVPVRDVYGFGRFSNPASNLCLDTLQREGDAAPLGVYPCHATLMTTQYLSLSHSGQLRDEEKCAELEYRRSSETEDEGRKVVMVSCRNNMRGQRWRALPGGLIQHMTSQLCLDAGAGPGGDVLATRCRRDAPSQRWIIDYNEENDFRVTNNAEPSEQEVSLRALRKNSHRISRSLLSVGDVTEAVIDSADNTTAVRRAHKHKKRRKNKKRKSRKRSKQLAKHEKKVKNKFILKVVRTLMNDTEEHLELEVSCRHRRLFPNNSFVRDLVAILNENHIKVINNGRVFERNKVTDLRTPVAVKEPVVKELTLKEPVDNRIPDKVNIGEMKRNDVTMANNIDEGWREPKPETIQSPAEFNKVEPVARGAMPSPNTKKIIVEDFVEVKPINPTTEVSKRKRRRRKRPKSSTAPPVLAVLRTAEDDDELRILERRPPEEHNILRIADQDSGEDVVKVAPSILMSIEDAPMALSQEARAQSEKEDTVQSDGVDNELWSLGEPRFRRNNTAATRRRSTRPDSDSELILVADSDQNAALEQPSEPPPTTANPASPVKLVMRSNLTFNLGDEFFAWRTRNLDDAVADVLEELIIPSNGSRGRVPPPAPPYVPVHPPSSAPSPPASNDASSSSESASGDR